MRTCAYLTIAVAALTACAHPRRDASRDKAPPLPVAPRTVSLDDDVLPLGKLPADVTPTRYRLSLVLDPSADDFSGDVAIHATLTAPREALWLHGQGLRVKRAQVTLADGTVIQAHWQQMTPDGLVRLSFARSIAPQDITIVVGYDASFSKRLQGLYKVVVAGQPYVFAQFEAIAARQAFPCFDEPRFKTPFDVDVTAPRYSTVISTTAIKDEKPDIVQKTVRFATTVPLPTYLLTFAVGDFDVVDQGPLPKSAVRDHLLPLRAVAIKGQGAKLAYALANTPPILTALEDYFGTAYPFDKLDIIAVPDFAAGAMENVGAVTFRDGLLLMHDPNVEQKRAFAEVMAHELSHMWFGNVVTMEWWDDTWLNESFATWMGHRVKRVLDPTADVSRVHDVLGVMHLDALVAAQQIHRPIEGSRDIASSFDGIAYEKGMGVLAMFEQYVGEDTFRSAVRAYMQRFWFGNATADDFLEALDAASGKDVSRAMRTFIEQPGVPLVEATTTCTSDQANVTLEQSRYFPLGSSGDPARRWLVPVCAKLGSDGVTRKECWLVGAPKMAMTLGKSCPQWLMANAEAAGYYRFAQPAAETASLMRHASDLSRSELLALADSLHAAVNAGRASPIDFFTAMPAFAKQNDPYLDAELMATLADVDDHVVEPAHRIALADFTHALFKGRLAAKWYRAPQGESDDAHVARLHLLDFLSRHGSDDAFQRDAASYGVTVMKALEDKHGDDAPELLHIALGAALRAKNEVTQDRVIAVLERTTDPFLRHELIAALASVRDREQIAKSLALVLSDKLRVSELWAMVSPLAMRGAARDQTWTWFEDNFDVIKTHVPDDQQGYLTTFASGFCSDEQAAEVDAFFAPRINGLGGGPQALAETDEAIRLCAARDRAQHQIVNDFFKAKEK